MSIHPVVKRSMKTRKGKGFSKAELRDAGLSVNDALKHRLPIDPRRSTKHEENVKTLKTYTKKAEPEAPAKEGKAKTAKPKEAKTVDQKAVKKLIKAVEDARSTVK